MNVGIERLRGELARRDATVAPIDELLFEDIRYLLAKYDALLGLLGELRPLVEAASKVRIIVDDINDFDGDRRGHYEALDDAARSLETVARILPPDILSRLLAALGKADPVEQSLPVDRETLGRFVREAWVHWARKQPDPKPSWLVPYDDLAEADKEADRQIGEAVAKWTLIHADVARSLTADPVEQSRMNPHRELPDGGG